MQHKTVSSADALAWRLECLHQRRRVVFTNGVFDLLHAGHVEYLAAARALGEVLVVGLNSDASVRRLKGPERPLCSQEDRALMLSALEMVDRVVLFDEDTPRQLILDLRPDILVKGADYPVEMIVGAAEVTAAGGRVETIALRPGRSSSELIRRIRQRQGISLPPADESPSGDVPAGS